MTYLFKRKPRFLPLLACLTAGSVQAAPDIAAPALQQWSTSKAQALGFLPNGTGDERLAASKREGLLLLDKQGNTLSRVKGVFAGLDSRALGDQVLVASNDKDKQQVAVGLGGGHRINFHCIQRRDLADSGNSVTDWLVNFT